MTCSPAGVGEAPGVGRTAAYRPVPTDLGDPDPHPEQCAPAKAGRWGFARRWPGVTVIRLAGATQVPPRLARLRACVSHGRTSHLGAVLGQCDRALGPDDRLNGDRPLQAAVSGVPGHQQPVEPVAAMAADSGVLAAAAAECVDAALEERTRAGHLAEVLRLRVGLCVTRKLPPGNAKTSFLLLIARSMPLALNTP